MELEGLTVPFALASFALGISITLATVGIVLALVGGAIFIFVALAAVRSSTEYDSKADSSTVFELRGEIRRNRQVVIRLLKGVKDRLEQLEQRKGIKITSSTIDAH